MTTHNEIAELENTATATIKSEILATLDSEVIFPWSAIGKDETLLFNLLKRLGKTEGAENIADLFTSELDELVPFEVVSRESYANWLLEQVYMDVPSDKSFTEYLEGIGVLDGSSVVFNEQFHPVWVFIILGWFISGSWK